MEKEKRGSVAPPEAGLEYFGGAFPAWNASKNPRMDYILNMVYKQNALIPSSRRNEEIIMPAFRMPKDPETAILGIAWFIISLFIILFLVSLMSGS